MNKSLLKLMPLVCRNFGQHGFAVDVGAHHGEFSKFLIQTKLFSNVVAFEPNSSSYLAIKKGINSDAGYTFEVVNSALSSESGLLDLYCDEDTSTASLLQYETDYSNNGLIKINSVSVTTLDEWVEENTKFGRLQFLKTDTQGNDLAVIRGGRTAISENRPIIQTEFIYIPLYKGQCSPTELMDFLSELDYELYSLNNLHISTEGRLCFCDAIFVPKELQLPLTHQFHCIDKEISFLSQIQTLTNICEERLTAINILDAEVQHLRNINPKVGLINSVFFRLKSWVQ